MALQLGLLDAADLTSTHASGLLLSIRESARARRLILQVIPPRTLEVVVPRGTRPQDVRSFVDENRRWIDRAGAELRRSGHGRDVELPRAIELAAIDRRVDVRYEIEPAAPARLRERGSSLVLRASDRPGAERSLRKWLLAAARTHLKPWLEREAERLELKPRSVHVRLQRTRWGSCSGSGNISLNASLLLVAPELVRYLLVHELCHLRYLNHSARYWRTVARFEPDYERLDRALSVAWTELPAWLYRVSLARG